MVKKTKKQESCGRRESTRPETRDLMQYMYSLLFDKMIFMGSYLFDDLLAKMHQKDALKPILPELG